MLDCKKKAVFAENTSQIRLFLLKLKKVKSDETAPIQFQIFRFFRQTYCAICEKVVLYIYLE